MNTHSGREKPINFRLFLDSGITSTIMMGEITSKIKQKQEAKNTWGTQTWKFTTLRKLNVDLYLPEFSTTKSVTWKCYVDDSAEGRYEMILARKLLTALGLDLKFSENTIIAGEGPYEGCL